MLRLRRASHGTYMSIVDHHYGIRPFTQHAEPTEHVIPLNSGRYWCQEPEINQYLTIYRIDGDVLVRAYHAESWIESRSYPPYLPYMYHHNLYNSSSASLHSSKIIIALFHSNAIEKRLSKWLCFGFCCRFDLWLWFRCGRICCHDSSRSHYVVVASQA